MTAMISNAWSPPTLGQGVEVMTLAMASPRVKQQIRPPFIPTTP